MTFFWQNLSAKMGRRKTVMLSAWIAVFAMVGLIFFSPLRINISWNYAPIVANQGTIAYNQHENYWTLPRNRSSVIPIVNSSIDIYIDLKKFREQVKQQNKECQNLTEDPFTMFKSRPSNTTKFTAEVDRKRIGQAFICGGVLYPEFLTEPPNEKLYPFENFYLSDPPLWDESTVASHVHSTISLYGPKKTFVVGDAVSLVIKMFDRKGKPRLKGGDRLKVWLKDVKFPHSISANITDFNNGTYLATTVLPWAGTVRVMATLRQSREFFRALAYVHRSIKSTIPFAGAYKNSQASESVPCSPFHVVPGFQKSELCNLTENNGSPWYCGRPSKGELNCSDFEYITVWVKFTPIPVTPAEDKILKQRTQQNDFIPGTIILQVEATKSGLIRLPDPNVPCNKVSARSTWHQSEPTGYFYHKMWKSFLCSVPDNPEKVDESCLKNIHIFAYGDSNSRSFYDRIQSKMKCKETVSGFHMDPKHAVKKICKNQADNVTLQLVCHSSPFSLGVEKLAETSNCYSPEELFSLVPSEGRYIIHFNHYLHLMHHHISASEKALIAVRVEIVKLLKRNPHGVILLRGPHVAERGPYVYQIGDSWAQYITTIQKETFRDLQDHIIYFPTWDITVASEDTNIHPRCNDHLSDLMLHFMCGRDQLSFLSKT